MIVSMTGYGEAQREDAAHLYHVELRSVNNRYFKAAIRLPEEFAFMEAAIEQQLRRKITRGSVTLRLFTRDLSESAAQEINLAAMRHYLTQLRAVANDPQVHIDLATLATLPGVCQPQELSEELRERAEKLVHGLVDEAIERLVAMRAIEGRSLAADLLRNCECVTANLDAIRTRVPLVVDEYRRRLMTRVQQLIAESNVSLAESDLLKEVAIYAERSDISEEVSRLGSHLEQFEAAVSSPEPAGRKLDFITQEMLREANTIGSKAGDVEIARCTIEIKGAIDRLKEQVQNAE